MEGTRLKVREEGDGCQYISFSFLRKEVKGNGINPVFESLPLPFQQPSFPVCKLSETEITRPLFSILSFQKCGKRILQCFWFQH